jgi:hypothetical protein
MQSLLEEVLEQMGLVDLSKGDAATEPKPVDKDVEEVLGVMSDPLKRLYAALCEMSKKLGPACERFQAEIERLHTESPDKVPDEARALAKEHDLLHERRKTLHDIFWMLVTSEFPKSGEDDLDVGIREGWQVVVYPAKHSSIEVRIGRPIILHGSSGLGEALEQLMGHVSGHGPRRGSANVPSGLAEALDGFFGQR